LTFNQSLDGFHISLVRFFAPLYHYLGICKISLGIKVSVVPTTSTKRTKAFKTFEKKNKEEHAKGGKSHSIDV
jgi:hypothetical protein